jgi:putative hydrolase of the HAD superfamily
MERADVALVLVDFDDTLVDTAPRFQNARRSLFALLRSLGAEESHVHKVHHEQVEALMLERHGLGPARLEHSFRHTYEVVCEQLGWSLSAELAARCAALGKTVAGAPPLIAGALDALKRLAGAFPTAVFTQAADRAYQMSCVEATGVHEVVGPDRVVVCERKTAAAFQHTLSEFRVENPASVWMIGNSIRSDINPALEVGARAILVEVNEPWEFDLVEPVSSDFVRVTSFAHAVDYLFALGV